MKLFLALLCCFSVALATDIAPDRPLPGAALTLSEALDILEGYSCETMQLSTDGRIAEQLLHGFLTSFSQCSHPHPAYIDTLAEALRLEFLSDLLYAHTTLGVQGMYLGDDTREPSRLFVPFSVIDTSVRVSLFRQNRQGLALDNGFTLGLQPRFTMRFARIFASSVEGRFFATLPDSSFIDLTEAYVSMRYKWLRLYGGKEQIYWSQSGSETSLFFGKNPPALNRIELGLAEPVVLPFLKRMGPTDVAFQMIFLGQQQFYSGSKVFVGRVTIHAHPHRHWNLTRVMLFGGKGSKNIAWWELPLEFVGIRARDGWLFSIPLKDSAWEQDAGIANNLFSIQLRQGFERLRGTEFIFEGISEDLFNVYDFFPQDAGLRLITRIPRLSDDGRWSMLIDASWIGQIVYTHPEFRSGFTYRGHIMGAAAGARTAWLSVQVSHLPTLQKKFSARLHYQVAFEDQSTHTPEHRLLGVGSATIAYKGFIMDATLGLQHIRGFNFNPAEQKLLPLVQLGVQTSF